MGAHSTMPAIAIGARLLRSASGRRGSPAFAEDDGRGKRRMTEGGKPRMTERRAEDDGGSGE